MSFFCEHVFFPRWGKANLAHFNQHCVRRALFHIVHKSTICRCCRSTFLVPLGGSFPNCVTRQLPAGWMEDEENAKTTKQTNNKQTNTQNTSTTTITTAAATTTKHILTCIGSVLTIKWDPHAQHLFFFHRKMLMSMPPFRVLVLRIGSHFT